MTPRDTLGTIDFASTPRPTMTRLVKVETRKMIDTRAGIWLLGITLAAALLAAAIALFAVKPPDATFDDFFANISGLQSILLPVIGVLLVTSEWGQRTALTTFTLEPNRLRIIAAKFIAAVIVTVGVLAFAFVVSLIAAGLASTIRGTAHPWNITATNLAEVFLNQLLGTIQGVAFGALILITAAAIVAIFALPTVLNILTALLPSTKAALDWINPGQTSTNLSNHTMGGNAWAQLVTSSMIFIVVPMGVGIWRVTRAEVK
jgi:ABC-type transport system involved in multi-copper enzyme maturation permease subunit